MKIGELIPENETIGQFRLIDALGAVTCVAVLLATLAPLLRLIDRENRTLAVTPAAALHVFVHFAVVMLAIAHAIYQRKRLEKQAGRRFGVAFCGPIEFGVCGPRMKSMLTLMGLIGVQIVFVVAQFLSDDFLMLALQSGLLALIYGGVIVNFLWSAYPGTVEFFESGIAVRQAFHPWTDVQLRTRTQSDDRIRLVIRQKLAGVPHASMELESAIRHHHSQAYSNQVHPLDRA